QIRDVREREPAAGRNHSPRRVRARSQRETQSSGSRQIGPAGSARVRGLIRNTNGDSMKPVRITAAGERTVEPMIALARCSRLARIIVTGAKSAEVMVDLHRLGYQRATTTTNCGLPSGQYDVALLDGRQCSIKAIETTLDWLVDFVNTAGVLIVWLDPHEDAAGARLRGVLDSYGFRIEAGTFHERGAAVAARRCDIGTTSKVA